MHALHNRRRLSLVVVFWLFSALFAVAAIAIVALPVEHTGHDLDWVSLASAVFMSVLFAAIALLQARGTRTFDRRR